ncbi:TetR/AcrR family transcriptional regulator [Haloechinothrix sp. LS1_15]|uniref:TetR/AcrR family transcriptional regulator n=1 Tax=Haloechinothrix sp. LS1_15 TaxID=2652248 RepID=UPI0029440540|nr:TetR/AcrR family transcriptional regulator [Haloechinothrix sp. LS1_15]MDV6014093.1 TetR/AcrR family transcriptional regulator [Haloechinothrix sp. LS1_15]
MDPVRRIVDGRRASTVQRLLDAALEEIRAVEYGDLSVRSVAKRADVSPATAYTYFSSKDHLISSVVWRRVQEVAASFADGADGAELPTIVRSITDVFAQEPELSRACTSALLADDPEVARLRDEIGAACAQSLSSALPPMPSTAVDSITMAFVGGLLLAGMGYMPFEAIADRLNETAEQLRSADGDHTSSQ